LPGLEIHTLNQDTAKELPALLVTRAGAIAAGGAALTGYQAPEISGAFSFIDTIPTDDDVVFSVLGKRIWDVDTQIEKKDRLAMFPVALGALASKATISTTTGCWSVLEEEHPERGIIPVWRDPKGYAFTWKPEQYGYKVERPDNFKGVQFHRMAFNMKRRLQGLPDLNMYQHLDHVCRWTGCCNIDHLEVVDRKRNNKLRDEARRFESAIIAGQIILGPTGKPELDEFLDGSDTEFTNIVMSTVAGPHRLVLIDKDPLLFRGEPEPCELLSSVAPPAPNKYERPSRTRKVKIHEGQQSMLDEMTDNEMLDVLYEEVKRVKQADLYKRWKKTGRL
jgi:hypothetical protein